MYKSRRGITLIALVVTIIVLLILAGISISMISGQNGILTKAGEAKTRTDFEQIKEELGLAITSASLDYYNEGKTGTLRDYLFSSEGQAKIKSELGTNDVTFNSSNHTITYKGIVFTIAEDGTIKSGIEVAEVDPDNLEAEELPADFWIASEGVAYINTKYIEWPEEYGDYGMYYGSYGYYGSNNSFGYIPLPGECQYTRISVPSTVDGEVVTEFNVQNVNNIVYIEIQEGIQEIPELYATKDTIKIIKVQKTTGITESDLREKLTYEFGSTNYTIENSNDNLFYIVKIKNYKWAQNEEGKIVSPDGTIELQIGDYVNYDPTNSEYTTITSYATENGYSDRTYNLSDYTGGWRVLGVDNGQIELISENSIGYLGLNGRIGYQNAEIELNKIAGLYGHGEYATGARSVNADDINKITGFNPNTVERYGVYVYFSWDGTDKPKYTTSDGLTGNLSDSHNANTSSYGEYKKAFSWYNVYSNRWEKSEYRTTSGYITSLENTSYWYNTKGWVENGSVEEELLFGKDYWLATKNIDSINTSSVRFYVMEVYTGVYGDGYYVSATEMARSYGYQYNSGRGVRAVVNLEYGIQLEENGTNSWRIK